MHQRRLDLVARRLSEPRLGDRRFVPSEVPLDPVRRWPDDRDPGRSGTANDRWADGRRWSIDPRRRRATLELRAFPPLNNGRQVVFWSAGGVGW